ncbi:50S ribosomal protein L32 [Slackia heliotrinireducens]|uniref:50S ribosomal protein L32 n=1 Tax=Slackia heliotrinireducens TaxID=84110 RepID=UPI0001A36D22|nr:50S ribosomal protein L32 [Slackia heliotrinireducens]VEG99987.1 50S ribosomal protein L32 [Slackia heliotrinireducens]
MAVPKRKTGRARTHSRRSANDVAAIPARSTCPQCGQPKLPHRVCGNCGYYGAGSTKREVIEVD